MSALFYLFPGDNILIMENLAVVVEDMNDIKAVVTSINDVAVKVDALEDVFVVIDPPVLTVDYSTIVVGDLVLTPTYDYLP